MAISLNRVEVIGNLTRDPELRYTPNGQAVASFAVATNRRYPDQQGNWIEADPEYHEVVTWAKLAEGVNRTLKKGDRVFVTGRSQTQSWEGQDGHRRTKTEIVADSVIGPDQVLRASSEAASAGAGPTVASPTPIAPITPAPVTPAPVNPTPVEPTKPVNNVPTAPVAGPKPDNGDEIDIEDIPF